MDGEVSMSPGVDAPDLRLTPMDISNAVGGFKVSNVVVEVFDDYHRWWERTSNCDSDSLMSMMFDLSLSHDIVGIQAYGIKKDRFVYISLKSSKGNSSNIDQEMMDAISRIEFDKGDKND